MHGGKEKEESKGVSRVKEEEIAGERERERARERKNREKERARTIFGILLRIAKIMAQKTTVKFAKSKSKSKENEIKYYNRRESHLRMYA